MLKQKHIETQATLRRKETVELPQELAATRNRYAQAQADRSQQVLTPQFVLGGKAYESMSDEAAERFKTLYDAAQDGQAIGSYGGMQLSVSKRQTYLSVGGKELVLQGNGRYLVEAGESGRGNLVKIANLYKGIPAMEEQLKARIEYLEAQIAESHKQAAKPFEREGELKALQHELDGINNRLRVDDEQVAVEIDESKRKAQRDRHEEKNNVAGQKQRF